MPDVLTTRISGLAEAEKLLAGLPDKLASTCVRKAMLDAAKIGKAALKAEAEKHDAGGHIRITKSGRQRLRHLSDTAIYTTRRFANGVQYSACGLCLARGCAGLARGQGSPHGDRRHRGPHQRPADGQGPWGPQRRIDRGRPRSRLREAASDRLAGVRAGPRADAGRLPGESRRGGRNRARTYRPNLARTLPEYRVLSTEY